MWSYHFSVKNPASRLLTVQFACEADASGITEVCLPRWRPGRYELGNFAKNLSAFSATNEKGDALTFTKKDTHSWIIKNDTATQLVVSYDYYAAQPDAGACWVDDELIYVNPVHCCMYRPGLLHTACSVKIGVLSTWTIACSLQQTADGRLMAKDFHELVDSPFFASSSLQHNSYSVNGIQFHIWFQGACTPDWNKILHDFSAFTKVQLEMMDSFPVKEYHFLVLILPFRFYHGVEHVGSTVLALGPGYQLMEPNMYSDLMGVASHELFHVWNVKTLRPADFNEYDYANENYSRLGWVYEGFTTYYGDLFLSRSGFFKAEEFLDELNQRLQKHADNAGKFNLGVADSSFETWLDGYVPGTPHRKTSIYDEGSLIALMLDLQIRKFSNGKCSLDDLFRRLYTDFSHPHGGYREQDVRMLAEEIGGKEATAIISELADTTVSYVKRLQEILPWVGCYISATPSKQQHEDRFGMRCIVEGGSTKVLSVLPGSAAAEAGIAKDDEIISCNGWKVEGNLSDLIRAGAEEKTEMGIFSQRKWKLVELSQAGPYFQTYRIVPIVDVNDEQKQAFAEWCGKELPGV